MAAQSVLEVGGIAPASQTLRRASSRWPLLIATVVAVDALTLLVAFGFAYLLRFKMGLPLLETPPHQVGFYSLVAFWAMPVWVLLFAFYRLYDRQQLAGGFGQYLRVLNACTAGMVVTILISFLDKSLIISRAWLVLVWGFSILLMGGTRFASRRLLWWLHRHGFLVARTVIVGANEEALAIAEQFLSDARSGSQILGLIHPAPHAGKPVLGKVPVLGGLDELEEVVRAWGVNELIVATTAIGREELLELYRRFGHCDDVAIRLSSGLFEILTTSVKVHEISCVSLLTPQRVRITGVDALLKSALDYVGACCGLLLLLPVLALLALLVKLDSPGPVVHRRRVLGRSGKPFHAFKFRTMVVDADAVLAANPELRQAFEQGYKLARDPRVTRIGRILRRTSLDELPQLFNVLRGEMSLVGPRMIAPDEVVRYGKWQLNLLTVKPGLTGPWQVRGRSDIPYEERVRLSTQYITNYSIWLDLEILLRTIPAVLRARGAY